MNCPTATYRVQLTSQFDFDAAAGLAHYLARLGVSHVYLSPVFEASPGSTHGYDALSHQRVRQELGGEASFERLCEAMHEAGLGVLLDIVPNHMAVIGGHNELWWDVLENGCTSRYAKFFDIDWSAPAATAACCWLCLATTTNTCCATGS